MASTDLVMNLVAHDRASATFGKVAGSADHAHSRISRMATLGRMLPVAAITAFGVASVKAFADAETSQSQLEGAYKRFPKMANENIGSLRSMNSELQRKTKFDDDDLAGMQAKLAMFDLTGQQVATLTPIVADYAQVSGKDVVSAGVAVGRAMMGNTRALKSLGIDYKMTGDKAKDAANIQALLAEKTKGAAEEFGKTSAGKLAILNNQFSDLKENVGEALVPALNSMVTAITPIAKIFGDLPAPVRTGAIAVVGLAAAYNFLSPALGGVKGVIGGMARVFGLSTAATVADTAATEANTVAHRANAASGGIPVGVGKSTVAAKGVSAAESGTGKTAATAGIAGVAATAQTAALGLAAYAAASYASYAGSKKLAEGGHTAQAGLLALVTAIPSVGTSLMGLREGYNNASVAGRLTAGSMAQMEVRLTEMAGGSGGPARVAREMQALKSQMDPRDFQQLIDSTPMLSNALKKAGYQINQTTGAIQKIPSHKQIVVQGKFEQLTGGLKTAQDKLSALRQLNSPKVNAEIAPLVSRLGAAQRTVDRLKQAKKPDVDAINRATARVNRIQRDIDAVRQRNKPAIDADGGPARDAINAVWGQLNTLVNTNWTATVHVNKVGPGAGGGGSWAKGGAASGLAVVGERGPELVSLPEGSFVYTHSQSLAMGVEHFAKNKPLTAKQKRQKAREDKRKKAAAAAAKKIKDARNEAYKTESSSIVSFARVTGFDSSDHASALDDQQSAQREVNMAKGIGERAKALEALAAANKRVAASAPTTANVLSTFRAKLAKINAFGSVLGQLRTKLGKNAASVAGKAILNAVLEEGPENGAVIGQALLSNNGLNQALAIQGQIDTQSRWMGLASADVTSGNYIKPRPAPKKPAKKNPAKKYAHITLKIDKRVVHKSLVELKREQGGKALGLA